VGRIWLVVVRFGEKKRRRKLGKGKNNTRYPARAEKRGGKPVAYLPVWRLAYYYVKLVTEEGREGAGGS